MEELRLVIVSALILIWITGLVIDAKIAKLLKANGTFYKRRNHFSWSRPFNNIKELSVLIEASKSAEESRRLELLKTIYITMLVMFPILTASLILTVVGADVAG